jgi:hypothetical protein
MRVGQELGLEEGELQNLEVAALLHDIGKVGIPDAILRKPKRLDSEEYALMKKHPEYGWGVLRMLPGFERAALDILHHHASFERSVIAKPLGTDSWLQIDVPVGLLGDLRCDVGNKQFATSFRAAKTFVSP